MGFVHVKTPAPGAKVVSLSHAVPKTRLRVQSSVQNVPSSRRLSSQLLQGWHSSLSSLLVPVKGKQVERG